MSKQFTMSMYSSKEDLYKAKAEYWEGLFEALWEEGFLDAGCYDGELAVDKEELLTILEDYL